MTSDEISRILAHSWDLLLLRLLWPLIMLFRDSVERVRVWVWVTSTTIGSTCGTECWNTPFSHQAGSGGKKTCCAFMITLIRAHREQIRAIWRGGFVGLGEIPSPPPLSDLIPPHPCMDFHYVYDAGRVRNARPVRGRLRDCRAALRRLESGLGTLGAMHTDVVLLNLLLWTVGVSGQPRPRGQMLEPYRHVRSVHECANYGQKNVRKAWLAVRN